MTTNIALAAGFVFLAVMMLISLVAILFRHAIPRAPNLFHALVGVPVVVSAVLCFLLAYMSEEGSIALWGVGLGMYRTVLVYALGAVFLSLNLYALYFYVAGRYRS